MCKASRSVPARGDVNDTDDDQVPAIGPSALQTLSHSGLLTHPEVGRTLLFPHCRERFSHRASKWQH